VFTFLPIVNFWAFYRIRKLRRYVLYVVVPSIVLGITYGISVAISAIYDPNFIAHSTDTTFIFTHPSAIAANAISWALGGFSIYLVIIWSRQHNKQFNQHTTTAEPSQ